MFVLVNHAGFYVHRSCMDLVAWQHGASPGENEATRLFYLPRRKEPTWTENLLDAACIHQNDYCLATWDALFPNCRRMNVVLSAEDAA